MKTPNKARTAEGDYKGTNAANKKVSKAASPANTETKPSLAASQSKKNNSPPISSRGGHPGKHTGSKKASVIALLRRANGATLPDLMKATGWQARSVRGFISGTLKKRMSLKVKSSKTAFAERFYQIRVNTLESRHPLCWN